MSDIQIKLKLWRNLNKQSVNFSLKKQLRLVIIIKKINNFIYM